MRRLTHAVPILCSALATLGFAAPACASPGTITNYPIPGASTPFGMTTGPDGKIWFVDSGNAGPASIGRMTTAGAITAADVIRFPDSTLGGTATLGPDGNMWVQQDNHLAKVPVAATQTSDITSYTLSSGNGGFASIASGPDGRLWFGQNHVIGTSTTDGTIGAYSTGTSATITGVLVGPDSKIWYAAGNAIARMSTTGVAGPGDAFTLPAGNANIYWMTVGPDDNVWFTEANPAAVGRITPAGVITIFPTPTTASLPFGIAAGPDGQLWFVERDGDKIGSIPTSATSGADITEYPVGGSNIGLEYIVAGPDKRMWFNEFNTQSLGAITTSAADVTAPPVTPPVLTPAVITPPAVTPTPPTDPAPPAPQPISATKAFTLPSAKRCISRRAFTIRIRKLPGVTFTSAVVKVNGKRVKTIARARITAPVNLKGLPAGKAKVSITATASDGRTVTGTRTYRTCATKRGSRGPKL
ncbi:MAG TPA: hypothetical protein VGO71_11810 [Baekduia sp.]|jgi:streptogramin lyase|nr:hypothetical protein [Baekduia sp.]